ncbi:MAG: hypothetical protein K9H25_15985 [Rhodospirillum sp.]|nr:hypothetical protein [Rhodospirillum sp.]MCF8490921.1 hypothetical protein [Rhodospirillum sp.]MCF8499076.1 hypothetical protein [Rhodospirillum sp.]
MPPPSPPVPPSPILFIHYGVHPNMRFTLGAARTFNPDKPVFLIGDEENAVCAALGVTHIPMESIPGTDRLARFDAVYQGIKGIAHTPPKPRGADYWLKFVFRRWFLMHAFLVNRNIESFWTFDTDVLLLHALAPLEADFRGRVDCTEQCHGSCMNGFVASRSVVEAYLDTIIALFEDEAFLQETRNNLLAHPGHAFTEMGAYEIFRSRTALRTVHLGRAEADAIFDDQLISSSPATDPYELTDFPGRPGVRVRNPYYMKDGRICLKRLGDGRMVDLHSVNTGGLPEETIEHLFHHGLTRLRFSRR